MATENTSPELFDFTVGGLVRVIKFIKTEQVEPGFTADYYSFIDDLSHDLIIFTLSPGQKTPPKKIHAGRTAIEGFVKGKGTLTVDLANGTKNSYYYEKEGLNKEVTVGDGQSVQWTAPYDSNLVFFEVREAPVPKPPDPAPKPAAAKPKVEKTVPKLLLTSLPITAEQCKALNGLTAKKPADTNLIFIPNGADTATKVNDKTWIQQDLQTFARNGYKVKLADLRMYQKDMISMLQLLQTADVIWVGGGNPFYLRWLLKVTRADEIIPKLVAKGMVYGGDSAGAVVAGPTLKHFEAADDAGIVRQKVLDGMSLTKTVVVPHVGGPDDKTMQEINNRLLGDGFITALLKDGEALLISGDSQRII